MQDISNSFRMAVNTSKERIIEILKQNKDISIIALEENKFIIAQNNVVINCNEDYDEVLSRVDEDAYLYYKNNMDFYPKDNMVLIEMQIELAKDISKKFSEYGISSEIIAEFEYLL